MTDMELAEEKAIFEILRALVRRCRILNSHASAKEMSKCAAIIAALRRGHERLPVELDHIPADMAEAVEMLRRAKEILLDSESMVRYWRDKARPPSGEMVAVRREYAILAKDALAWSPGEKGSMNRDALEHFEAMLSTAEAEGRKS